MAVTNMGEGTTAVKGNLYLVSGTVVWKHTGILPYTESSFSFSLSGLGALSGVSELDCLRFQMSSVSVALCVLVFRSAAGVEHIGAFAPPA